MLIQITMKICMIGTGYVGLVSGTCFADLGNKVYCLDKDENKIKKLNLGVSPIFEPGLDEIIKKNHNAGRLIFTTDLNESIKNSNIIFICVGTPQKKGSHSVDLKYVFQAVKENYGEIRNWIKMGKIISFYIDFFFNFINTPNSIS